MENVYSTYFEQGIESYEDFTNFQVKIGKFYDELFNCINMRITKAYAKELFGHRTVEDHYRYINHFHYLAMLMYIIEEQKQIDINNGNTYDVDYYAGKYNIECIRKRFACLGCDIGNALAVFDLDRYQEGCTWTSEVDWCSDKFRDFC